MRVKVVDFQMDHLMNIDAKSVYGEPALWREQVRKLIENKVFECKTICVDGTPAAILCISDLGVGVSEVTSIQSELVKRAPVAFHKAARSLLNEYSKKRIYTDCRRPFTRISFVDIVGSNFWALVLNRFLKSLVPTNLTII